MAENEEKKEEPQEEQQPLSMVEKAVKAAERLEKANEEMRTLIDRQEQMAAEKLLSGRADAGTPEDKPKEETPAEYKDRIMRGEA